MGASLAERKRKAVGRVEDWRRREAKRRKRFAERAQLFQRPLRCKGEARGLPADGFAEEGPPEHGQATVLVVANVSSSGSCLRRLSALSRFLPHGASGLGIDEFGLPTKRRRSVSIGASEMERHIFMSHFAATGGSGCKTYSQFARKALTATRKTTAFALGLSLVSLAQSTISLFPPSFMPSASPLELALPPLVYMVLISFGLGQIAVMNQSYEEFLASWQKEMRIYAIRVSVIGALFVGGRFLVHSHGTSRTMFFAELFGIPTLMNLDVCFSVSYGVVRRRLRVWEALRVCSRLLVTGSYIFALTLMLFANVYFFPELQLGSYRGRDYMGVIVGLEKFVLLLLKNLCIQWGPCGYPRFLFNLSIHFEMDTVLLASLALAASQDVGVALQHLALDWVMAVFEIWTTLTFDLNLTMDELQKMHWFVWLQYWPAVYLTGSTSLWISNLFVGRAMNNLLDRIAKTTGYAWVLLFLSLVTLSDSPDRQMLAQYFLPAGTSGLVYVAAQLVCSLLQDFVVKLAMVRRGVDAARFSDSLTKTIWHTIYYLFYFSYTSWILHSVAVMGWRIGDVVSY